MGGVIPNRSDGEWTTKAVKILIESSHREARTRQMARRATGANAPSRRIEDSHSEVRDPLPVTAEQTRKDVDLEKSELGEAIPKHGMIGCRVAGIEQDGSSYHGTVIVVQREKTKKSSALRYTVEWDGDYDTEAYDSATVRLLKRNFVVEATEQASRRKLEDTAQEGRDDYLYLSEEEDDSLEESGEDEVYSGAGDTNYARNKISGEFELTKKGRSRAGLVSLERVNLIEDDSRKEKSALGAILSDVVSDDDLPISRYGRDYGSQALALMQGNLAKRTTSSYKTALKAWNNYLAESTFSGEILDWSPERDDPFLKSAANEKIFMGFVLYCVMVRGVCLETAKKYKNNTISQLNTETGINLSYGQKWNRMAKFLKRAEVAFPHDKRVRLPFLQQHLLFLKRVIVLFDQGATNVSRLSKELSKKKKTYKKKRLEPIVEVLNKYGSELTWALMTITFFGVSRAGDSLPQTISDFNPQVDTTISDVCYTPHGFNLRFKVTKTGRNSNFRDKPFVRVTGNALCPVTALEAYLNVYRKTRWYGEGHPTKLPLFSDGQGRPIATRSLREMVKASVTAMGLDSAKYGAHSLRIGGATAALAAPSSSEYKLRVLGYWNSNAVMLYTKPSEKLMRDLCTEMMGMKRVDVIS